MIIETVAKLARYYELKCLEYYCSPSPTSICTCRLEFDLQAIETQHQIDSRWNQTSAEYQEVSSVLNSSDKQLLKGKLLGFVKERIFYLNTLRYHAGL